MSSTEENEWMLPRRRRDLDEFGPPGLPGAGPLDVPMKTTSLSLEVHSSNITLNSSCRPTPGCSTVCTVFCAIFHTFQTTSGFFNSISGPKSLTANEMYVAAVLRSVVYWAFRRHLQAVSCYIANSKSKTEAKTTSGSSFDHTF